MKFVRLVLLFCASLCLAVSAHAAPVLQEYLPGEVASDLVPGADGFGPVRDDIAVAPVLKGGDYTPSKIIAEVFPSEAQALFQMYRDAFAGLARSEMSLVADFSTPAPKTAPVEAPAPATPPPAATTPQQ